MYEIFDNYWWLLFPLIFLVVMPGWNSFMRYKGTKAKIELLKTYAASGKEPPADLIASLDADKSDADWPDGDHGHRSRSRGGSGTGFLVILFAGLAAVFAYTGYAGLMGADGEAFYFIAMILGVLALAFLASSILRRKPSDD
jgi:hypothetical protein